MVDCWAGEPSPLIICKARSTKGVLERIVREYLAPITATGGHSGGFIVNDPRTACREIRPVGQVYASVQNRISWRPLSFDTA